MVSGTFSCKRAALFYSILGAPTLQNQTPRSNAESIAHPSKSTQRRAAPILQNHTSPFESREQHLPFKIIAAIRKQIATPTLQTHTHPHPREQRAAHTFHPPHHSKARSSTRLSTYVPPFESREQNPQFKIIPHPAPRTRKQGSLHYCSFGLLHNILATPVLQHQTSPHIRSGVPITPLFVACYCFIFMAMVRWFVHSPSHSPNALDLRILESTVKTMCRLRS